MLRYFSYGQRNFRILPDIPTQRFNWEFYVIFDGKIRPEPIARKVQKPETKNFWILRPGSSYFWEWVEPVARRAVFHFAYVSDLLSKAAEKSGFLALSLDREQLAFAERLAHEAFESYNEPTAVSQLIYEKILLELSLLALQNTKFTKTHAIHKISRERTERAIAWYREHLLEEPTLGQVAEGIHVSASHLRRHFYQVTGNSPYHSFLTVRMQKATEILSTTSLTLDEISPRCGFSSAAAFCRAFKKFYNTTPHTWRRGISTDDPRLQN